VRQRSGTKRSFKTLSAMVADSTIRGTLKSSGGVTDSTLGALMKLQLCYYDSGTDSFTNGLFPSQWSNGTMAITADVTIPSSIASTTNAQTALAQISSAPVVIDSLSLPAAVPGYPAGVLSGDTLDLTGVAANTEFILQATGTAGEYGDTSNYVVSAIDSSSGITITSTPAGSTGVTFSYTPPSP